MDDARADGLTDDERCVFPNHHIFVENSLIRYKQKPSSNKSIHLLKIRKNNNWAICDSNKYKDTNKRTVVDDTVPGTHTTDYQ